MVTLDAAGVEGHPQPPLLSSATRENDPPDHFLILAAFEAHQGAEWLSQLDKLLMPFIRVR